MWIQWNRGTRVLTTNETKARSRMETNQGAVLARKTNKQDMER